MSNPEDARRLGIAELEARLGMHRHTIERWYHEGKFVPPHYFGRNRRWWLHEIEAWERAHQTDAPPGRDSVD